MICGTPVHLFALRVETSDDGCQIAWRGNDAQFDDEFNARSLAAGNLAFETMQIEGLEGDWVIFAEAFAA